MGISGAATTGGGIISAATNVFKKGADAMKSNNYSKSQESVQQGLASANQGIQEIKAEVASISASGSSGGANQSVNHDAQSGDYSQSL
jgi:hypothetical protein